MKPTRTILKPFKNEILKETALHGQQSGISLANKLTGCKGYGFQRWLEETTGDEHFGLHPTNPKSIRSNYWLIRQKIEQAFLQSISNLEAIADKQRENEELEREIRLLKWKLMEARRQGAPANELKLAEVSQWQ
jgi:hypothetical protein